MDLVRWVTEHEAAELVNRSPRTLRLWRQRGEVSAFRQAGLAGLVVYDEASIRKCAATQALRYQENVGRPATT